jgi:tetratricopeptide (TPR) repeat protein
MGLADETEKHVLEAFRLSPRDVAAYWWMFSVGLAKLQLGKDPEAVAWLRRSIDANRNYAFAQFALAAALGLLGELDEARTVARRDLRSCQALLSTAFGSAHQATIQCALRAGNECVRASAWPG